MIQRREASTFPDEVEFAFQHALLREAAYAMLADADRALGHRLAAAWLERAGEGDAMVLAEHYRRGGEPERALGFFLTAAQQALHGEDLDAAIARADRGLACGATGEDEVALLSVRGEATTWKGEIPLADAITDEVLAKASPGTSRWYWALTGRAIHATLRGDRDRLAAAVSLALSVAPSAGSAATLVGTVGAVAWVLFTVGLFDLGVAAIARMEEAAASIPERDLRAHAWLGFGRTARAFFVDGDAWAALELTRRATARFAEAGDVKFVAVARQREAQLYLQLGAWRSVDEALGGPLLAAGAPRPSTPSIANGLRAPVVRIFGALAAVQRGAPAEAIAHLARLQDEPIAQGGHGALVLSIHASAYLLLGDLDAAEGAARAALDTPSAPVDRPAALAALADLRLAQGRSNDALAAAAEGLALVNPRIHDLVQSRLRLAQIDAILATGGDASAPLAAARDRILESAARIGDPDLRRSFLEDIPTHARTLRLAAESLR